MLSPSIFSIFFSLLQSIVFRLNGTYKPKRWQLISSLERICVDKARAAATSVFCGSSEQKNGFEKKTDLVGAELLFDVTAGGRTANFCEHRATKCRPGSILYFHLRIIGA